MNENYESIELKDKKINEELPALEIINQQGEEESSASLTQNINDINNTANLNNNNIKKENVNNAFTNRSVDCSLV
jgi:hypothetical protein